MVQRTLTDQERLRRLLDACLEYVPSDDWPREQSFPGFAVRTAPDGTALPAADSAMRAVGREAPAGEGERQRELATALASRSGPILAIMATRDESPLDLVASEGLLLGTELPLEAWLQDVRIAPMLANNGGRMLVVPTMQDMIICLGLGLPAAPATWFAGLSREQLATLERLTATPRLSLPSNTPSAPSPEVVVPRSNDVAAAATGDQPRAAIDPQGPVPTAPDSAYQPATLAAATGVNSPADSGNAEVTLVFSGFDFVNRALLPNQQLQSMISGVADAQRYLDCDFSNVAVWWPSEATLLRLEYGRTLRAADVVVQTIRQSLDLECYDLLDTYSGTIEPWQVPQTFLAARAKLQQCLADPNVAPEILEVALERFEQRMQTEIIDPLMQEALQCENRVRGALMLAFANTSELLQSLAPFLRSRLVRSFLVAGSRDERDQLDRTMKRSMLLMDRLLRLARELGR